MFKYDLDSILGHLHYGSDMALKGGEVAEGLAFFYNKKRFKHIESKRIVFSECIEQDPLYADIWAKISQNEKLAKRILDRSTTLQINVVESLENNNVLVVANTHLYFHPDADHIRLLHGGIAIRCLEDFIEKLKNKVRPVLHFSSLKMKRHMGLAIAFRFKLLSLSYIFLAQKSIFLLSFHFCSLK